MTKYILPSLLILLGTAVLGNAVIATVMSNLSTGIWLTYAIGALLITGGVFFNRLPMWLWIVGGGGLLTVAVCIAMLFGFGKTDTVTNDEDVILVLGASIKGDKPTKSLQNRLDRAVALHKENPDAVIVVSGGKGSQETVSEAQAMAQYLIAQGVPADSILEEDAATSTDENFRLTKALLEAHFDKPYTVCFVTTDYHIYRASLLAEKHGFDATTHAHSGTPWYMVLPSGLRECLAACKTWLIP